MALATANGTERNRLVRDQLFPVDFYNPLGKLRKVYTPYLLSAV